VKVVFLEQLPFRHFWMYHLATMHNVTNKQTDKINHLYCCHPAQYKIQTPGVLIKTDYS